MVAVAVEAGGLVKAARELFRLQVVWVLMACGALSCRRPRSWFRRGALAASRASAAFCRLGSVTLSSQARYANLYWLYGFRDRCSRRHLGAGTRRHSAVQVYYWLNGEGSAWVGFWLFDTQACITLILGGLLALIALFASYGHVHLPLLGAVELTPGLMALGLENVEPCVYTGTHEW